MCMCGENLVSIRCLDIFSASLWNLYSTGSFQKAFLKNEAGQGEGRLWSRRDQILVVHGTDCSSLFWAGQNSPFSCPGLGPCLGSLGSLCPTALLLLNTEGLESSPGRGPGGRCLSDPLNLIMNELLSLHLPWWHKFIYLCLPSAMVKRDCPSSLWGKHEKNEGLDFHGLMRQERSLHS